MKLAGIVVNALGVLGLAELLVHGGHWETAAFLLDAQAAGAKRVGLSTKDREAILAVLPEPPEELCELRRALVVDRLGEAIDSVV